MEQKDTKKIIILGILILIIVPIWIRALKPRGKRIASAPRTAALEGSSPSQAVTPSITNDTEPMKKVAPMKIDIPQDNEKEKVQKKRMALPWSRDPFVAQGKLKKKGPSAPTTLHLSGIMWDEKKPAAIINDNIVSAGDEVQGKKIIKIEKDKVILQEDGQEYILRLEE
jgi:hypothetical protein